MKGNVARVVPLHEHLVEQGFIAFTQAKGRGPLFYDPGGRRKADTDPTNPTRQPWTKARDKLSEWVRSLGVDDPGISPNHAWRHTYKRRAARAGIERRIRFAMCGHTSKEEGDAYETPSVEDLATGAEVPEVRPRLTPAFFLAPRRMSDGTLASKPNQLDRFRVKRSLRIAGVDVAFRGYRSRQSTSVSAFAHNTAFLWPLFLHQRTSGLRQRLEGFLGRDCCDELVIVPRLLGFRTAFSPRTNTCHAPCGRPLLCRCVRYGRTHR